MSSDTVLEVSNLSKIYSRQSSTTRKRAGRALLEALIGSSGSTQRNLREGEFWGLEGISFELKRGEALGVIGFNGAGKTTLLRLLSGQIIPDRGEIRRIGKSVSMIDLTAGFNMNATGRQNIHLRSAMLGRTMAEVQTTFSEIVDFSELGDAIDAPIATYSSGMMMRLAFSIMIVSNPDLLFIDEILSVGDFRFRQKCLGKIRELRSQAAFVLVSHSLSDIKAFCDRVLVLDKGKVVFEGDPEKAIVAYENTRYAAPQSVDESRSETLKPQFHNEQVISELKHSWCDSRGAPLSEIQQGDDLYLTVNFKINYQPRNLILGVPVWSDSRAYVTGFSTLITRATLQATPNQTNSYRLKIPNLSFNPGSYISNIAIHDGPEFLYRGANPVLNVLSTTQNHWGAVTLAHEWQQVS